MTGVAVFWDVLPRDGTGEGDVAGDCGCANAAVTADNAKSNAVEARSQVDVFSISDTSPFRYAPHHIPYGSRSAFGNFSWPLSELSFGPT